jgi:hypothetical protein
MDNGDHTIDSFIHWCVGCCPDGEDGRCKALEKTVAAYLELLGGGFQSPLLVRWKHADVSQRYIRDSMGLHKILIRTLNHMGGKMTSEQAVQINDLIAAGAAAGFDSEHDRVALQEAKLPVNSWCGALVVVICKLFGKSRFSSCIISVSFCFLFG